MNRTSTNTASDAREAGDPAEAGDAREVTDAREATEARDGPIRTWGDDPDAFVANVHVEVIGWKASEGGSMTTVTCFSVKRLETHTNRRRQPGNGALRPLRAEGVRLDPWPVSRSASRAREKGAEMGTARAGRAAQAVARRRTSRRGRANQGSGLAEPAAEVFLATFGERTPALPPLRRRWPPAVPPPLGCRGGAATRVAAGTGAVPRRLRAQRDPVATLTARASRAC
jgi:hypothetical protein